MMNIKKNILCYSVIIVSLCSLASCDSPVQEKSKNAENNAHADLPWYKTTYRWAQTNFTEDDPVKVDLEFWRQQWRRTKTQGVIINCGGIVAYYPSKYEL